MSTIQLAYQTPLCGKKVGVVFGTYAPMHQGHLDLVFKAKKECDGGCVVIVCGEAGDRGDQCGLPLSLRYQYVRELFKDDDLVAVYAIDDGALGFSKDYSFEQWKPWLEEFNRIVCDQWIMHDELVWYVGERQYHDDLVKLGYSCVLVERSKNPISATMIRMNPLRFWNQITLPFRRAFSQNVLIIGTASEGKSHLAMDLAKYFSTAFASEWARGYMEKYCLADWNLKSHDFMTFLFGQSQHIAETIESPANNGVCFVDSDAITTAMYAKHYAISKDCDMTPEEYERVADVAELLAKRFKWAKIFLVPPHGEFVDDHSRYMKDADMEQREKLYAYMCEMIQRLDSADKVQVLSGDYMENFETVANFVRGLYREG